MKKIFFLYFFILFFTGTLSPFCYFKETTLEDLVQVTAFCEERNIDQTNLVLHLNNQNGWWASTAIDIETHVVKSLALGRTLKGQQHTTVQTFRSDENIPGLLEAHLFSVLALLKKKNLTTCSLPAQAFFRSAMRSISTSISDMLNLVRLQEFRFEFFNNLLEEASSKKAILEKYIQLAKTHNYPGQNPALNFQKQFQDPSSGLVVCFLGNVLIGAASLLVQENQTMSEHKKYIIDFIVVDEGFQHQGLGKILLEKCTEEAKMRGVKSLLLRKPQENWLVEKALNYGFVESKKIAAAMELIPR